jgi:NAD(P)-dependent dehydrogenase (short-subunit alcohol dehydrogenase family)
VLPRSILITGSSSGIGHDAAHALAARGWRVFATCRQEADCARLRAEGLESFRLDHTDPGSIEAAVAEALARTGGTLHALYNNGAHAIGGAVEDTPAGALRAVFEANVVGVHDLTRRVIPVMRAQGHGRIVTCSSVLGFAALPWRGAYNASKFAIEGLMDTLRLELRGTSIHVVLLQPGPITTRIRVNSQPHFERWIDWRSSALRDFYETRFLPRLYDDSGTPARFELPPAAVTRALIRALTARRPQARYPITVPTHLARVFATLLPGAVWDRMRAGW